MFARQGKRRQADATASVSWRTTASCLSRSRGRRVGEHLDPDTVAVTVDV